MYKNVGIKPKYSGWLDMGDLDTQMEYIQCDTKEEWDECVFMSRSSYSSDDENYDKPKMEYPPFTTKKQIELIKFIASLGVCEIENWNNKGFHFAVKRKKIYPTMFLSLSNINLQETLADVINNLWQDLTPEEKQQVKGILE